MSRTFGETVAFLNNLKNLIWFLSLGFFCVCDGDNSEELEQN